MSTWISRLLPRPRAAVGAGLVAAGFLAGCLDTTGAGGGGPGRTAPKSIRVASGEVTVAGPRGYCIDRSATRTGGQGAFVLLGSCAAISQNPRDARPQTQAVLTVSVSAADAHVDAASLDRMQAFLTTEPGRRALSRAGDAATVQVHRTLRNRGAVLLHASDTAENRLGKMSDSYWRGFFTVSGRLITVTAAGFDSRPISDRAGLSLIRAFVSSIRAANPETGGAGGLG